MGYKKRRLKSWPGLHKYHKRGWMYRGQQWKWKLTTSLDRYFERERISGSNRVACEQEMMREFRRAFHHYAVHVPHPRDTLEWLSLMQHHGAPTRLLDFSYSIYVAAYFALEHGTGDGVIWAIRRSWALRESIALMKTVGKKKAHKLNELYDESHRDVFGKCLMKGRSVLCVVPQNPFRLNERLRLQQGVFMASGSVKHSFAKNMANMKCSRRNVIRIKIPRKLRRSILSRLYDMGISQATLFPGLDGYARSLGVYQRKRTG